MMRAAVSVGRCQPRHGRKKVSGPSLTPFCALDYVPFKPRAIEIRKAIKTASASAAITLASSFPQWSNSGAVNTAVRRVASLLVDPFCRKGHSYCRKANLVCTSLRIKGSAVASHAHKSRQAAKSCPAGRTYQNWRPYSTPAKSPAAS